MRRHPVSADAMDERDDLRSALRDLATDVRRVALNLSENPADVASSVGYLRGAAAHADDFAFGQATPASRLQRARWQALRPAGDRS